MCACVCKLARACINKLFFISLFILPFAFHSCNCLERITNDGRGNILKFKIINLKRKEYISLCAGNKYNYI